MDLVIDLKIFDKLYWRTKGRGSRGEEMEMGSVRREARGGGV